MPLQSWIHHWEQGGGARLLKVIAAVLGFVVLAGFYDISNNGNFSSEEAMENAQLARNISEGKGCTTDSIRPIVFYLLENAAEPGQSSKILAQPTPDLSLAPAYPFILAGLMKALPFDFAARDYWSYQPERWINVFNQALFFVALVLVFLLARKLFDLKVAWLAAALFAGTELFWQFSVSGISTIWVILIFLGIVTCMTTIESRDRAATEGVGWKSVPLAVFTGALVGVGGLSRYAFAWIIVPILLFVWFTTTRGRGKLCVAIAVSFLAVMIPWLARNVMISGHCFGTDDYALVQGTPPFPDNTLERSSDPVNGMRRVAPADIMNKFLGNAHDICTNDLPKLGGNWISAFFLAGLLIPFRNVGLMRLRWFLLGSLILFVVIQALGRTHISDDSPGINSENLLVLLAPLAIIFGAALFYTLLDQLNLGPMEGAGVLAALFIAVLCAPFVFALLTPRIPSADSPYSPLHIQQIAGLMNTNESMMSDIPGGTAWYGKRACVWLPLDDDKEFFKVNAFKPVHGLFLTQMTTDERFLSQMKADPKSWGSFVLECAEHGEVPTGFPLRKAPMGLLPEQLFLSDQARWRVFKTNP